jgi:hypothetical protein
MHVAGQSGLGIGDAVGVAIPPEHTRLFDAGDAGLAL